MKTGGVDGKHLAIVLQDGDSAPVHVLQTPKLLTYRPISNLPESW